MNGEPGTALACPACGAGYDDGTYFCVSDGMRLRPAAARPKHTFDMRWAANAPEAQGEAESEAPAPPRRPQVFMCEDSELFISLTTAALDEMGVDVTVARTGGEALAMAARVRPTIVLMDVELPDGSGDDFASRLAATHFRNTPIYLYSSLSDAVLATRARRAGCTGFISKQRGVHAMVFNVKRILQKMGAV